MNSTKHRPLIEAPCPDCGGVLREPQYGIAGPSDIQAIVLCQTPSCRKVMTVSTVSNKHISEFIEEMKRLSKPKRLEMSHIHWEYEDELPEMEDSDFDALHKASRVNGVRMYPFVMDSKGNRIWIRTDPNLSLFIPKTRKKPKKRNPRKGAKD